MADITPEMLKNFIPKHDFFIGIDSDGCVFDTMELKHKECFCPQFIRCFNLQAVSKYAREVWEFVNLYSKTRGANRFIALITAMDLLRERPEVKNRYVKLITLNSLKNWIKRGTALSNQALKKEINENSDHALKMALEWSEEVNASVRKMVHHLPPFPLVKEALQSLSQIADIIVVSQAATEAIQHEWQTNKIAKFAQFLCGQEVGTKSQHIQLTASGKYDNNNMLILGDAPGDLSASKYNHALFFPIIPGAEEESWHRFFTEGIQRFSDGTYAGAYETYLINKFEESLPEKPPW